MYYLLVLPVIFLAVIVKLVSDRYKLKIFSKICKMNLTLVIFLLTNALLMNIITYRKVNQG